MCGTVTLTSKTVIKTNYPPFEVRHVITFSTSIENILNYIIIIHLSLAIWMFLPLLLLNNNNNKIIIIISIIIIIIIIIIFHL